MYTTTQTTVSLLATLGAFTLLACLCGATLPPKPYFVWVSIVGLQAILCSNSSQIARWMRGPDAKRDSVDLVQLGFLYIVLVGSTYSIMANLIVHDGVTTGPRDGHEFILCVITVVMEFCWMVLQTLCKAITVTTVICVEIHCSRFALCHLFVALLFNHCYCSNILLFYFSFVQTNIYTGLRIIVYSEYLVLLSPYEDYTTLINPISNNMRRLNQSYGRLSHPFTNGRGQTVKPCEETSERGPEGEYPLDRDSARCPKDDIVLLYLLISQIT
jgi:hypothetical protein